MSKELTPLEAFYELGDNTPITDTWKIVETALKRLKKIETTTHSVLREDISKKLKALEIIKEKRVNVDYFIERIKKDTDYKEYKKLRGLYKITIFSRKNLTQEEFDLLKEILTDGKEKD